MAPADGLQDAWSDDTRKGAHAGRGHGSGMARAHECECLHGSGLAACEGGLDVFGEPTVSLNEICEAMAVTPKWADAFGIPLKAEGFTSNYYKKD